MNTNNIDYPIGIQSFREIISKGYLYVDKTAYIPDLLRNGKYKFLSRPRRFGKSLLISTLEAFFKGERELFKNLAIDNLMPEQWERFPVIHLDFSGEDYHSTEVLESKLNFSLSQLEKEYGIAPEGDYPAQRFTNIITGIYAKTNKQVVILIDEYDNPITSAIDNTELQTRFREILYGFYSSMKSLDQYLRFVMLTGITKYGHLSVFSGLNNLADISLENKFAGICGITEDELHRNFHQGIEDLAAEYEYSVEEAYTELKDYYDGYHFSKAMLDIYNPFSVLNAIARKEISDYWFQSGIPTILMKSLQSKNIDIRNLDGIQTRTKRLNDISVYNIDSVALLFQTGYLTIKGYDRETDRYTLGYPNREILTGFMDSILEVYGNVPDSDGMILKLTDYIKSGDAESFVETLKIFFSGIPYDLRKNIDKYENYYHSLIYVLVKLLGLTVDAEYHTSEGSIDIIIKTTRFIYIIELKIHGDAESAMRQIEEKKYSEPFLGDSRQLIKIGIGFANTTHTIDSVLISL